MIENLAFFGSLVGGLASALGAGVGGAVSSIVTGTLDTSSTISGANQPHVQAATAVNQNAGPTNAAEAHTNLQPYIVCYIWERTA